MKDKDRGKTKNSVTKRAAELSQPPDPQELKSDKSPREYFLIRCLEKKFFRLIFWFLCFLILILLFWVLWKNFLPNEIKSSVSDILGLGKVYPRQLHIEAIRKKIEEFDLNNNTLKGKLAEYKSSFSNQSIQLNTVEKRLNSLELGNGYKKLIKPIIEEQKRLKFAQEKLTVLVSQLQLADGTPEIKSRLQRLEKLVTKNIDQKNLSSDKLNLRKKINQRLKVLEAENEQLSKTVAALQSRIRIQETQDAQSSQDLDRLNNVGVLMLAFANLEAAISSGKGFQEEWAAVSILAVNNVDLSSALNIMQPFMKNGVPTLNQLRREFLTVADNISKISVMSNPDGWIPAAIDRISSLITIRRVGTNSEKNSRYLSPTYQAEKFLASEDLNSAITVVERLSGKAAKIAAPWLSRAQARAKVNKVLKKSQIILLSISGMQPGR